MVDLAVSPASTRQRRITPLLAEVAAVAGLLALALSYRVPNLDAYTGSFDEGIRAEQLLLMSAGYRPFKDIFASQGPLLLDLLYPFYLLFGQTLTAARAGVVVCSVLALLAAGWTARQIAGPLAGLAAIYILGMSPTFLDGSRLALAEVPTLAPSLLVLGCLLAYRRGGARSRWWLALAAFSCALALLIKPMAIHVGAPITVLLLLPPPAAPTAGSTTAASMLARYGRRWILDVAGFGIVVAAICAVVVLALGPAGVWDNLGAYRGGAGHGLGSDAAQNLRLTFNIMRQEQIGLYALAGVGALIGLWRCPVPTVALLAWAAAVLALFALYGDLADKHIVILVPSVALLAAVGCSLAIAALIGRVRAARGSQSTAAAAETISTPHQMPGVLSAPGQLPPPTGRLGLAMAVVGAVGLLAYAAFIPAVNAADRFLLREAPKIAAERRGRAVDQEIADIIRERTPADGWVLADNPLAAYWARRLVIPYLVDTSGTRIDAGSLTSALAVDQIQKYRPSVIVTWPRRLGKLDELTRRLPELGYRLHKSYELGWKVYVREG